MPLRKLTKNEIESIIDSFEFVIGAIPRSKEVIINNIKQELRRDLSGIKISPENNGVTELSRQVVSFYVRKLIEAGFPIGIRAAEALTRELTQDALNGKNNTGVSQSKVTHLDIFEEIVSFKPTESSKLVTTILHFKPETNKSYVTFDQLNKAKYKIKQLSLADVTLDYIEPDNPELFFLENTESNSDNIEPDQYQPWYRQYRMLANPRNIKDVDWFIRIKVDVSKLYMYRITIGQFCKRLKEIQNNLFECYVSPVLRNKKETFAYLDIYALKSQIGEAMSKIQSVKRKMTNSTFETMLLDKLFLSNIILEEMDSFTVAGIKNIVSYDIKETKILEALGESIKETGSGEWKMWLNYGWLNYAQLSPKFVTDVLDNLDLDYTFDDSNPYIRVKSDRNPVKIIKESYDEMSSQFNKYMEEQYDKKKKLIKQYKFDQARAIKFTPPKFSGLQNSLYHSYYVELGGVNLASLFSFPEVDRTTTYTNDLETAFNTFGIGITRNIIIKRLHSVFQGAGVAIDPGFIVLLADKMCFPGKPNRVNFYGMSETDTDPLIRTISKSPATVMSEAALYGEQSNVKQPFAISLTGQTNGKLVDPPKMKTKIDTKPTIVSYDDIIDEIDKIEDDDDLELPEDDFEIIEETSTSDPIDEAGIVELNLSQQPPIPSTLVGSSVVEPIQLQNCPSRPPEPTVTLE